MSEAASAHAIGTEGLQGAVTTPAEKAAIDMFRKLLEERKAAAGRVTVSGMVGAIDVEIAAREAGARVTAQVYGGISAGTLDHLIALESTIDFLRMVEPHRKAIWKLVEAANRGAAR